MKSSDNPHKAGTEDWSDWEHDHVINHESPEEYEAAKQVADTRLQGLMTATRAQFDKNRWVDDILAEVTGDEPASTEPPAVHHAASSFQQILDQQMALLDRLLKNQPKPHPSVHARRNLQTMGMILPVNDVVVLNSPLWMSLQHVHEVAENARYTEFPPDMLYYDQIRVPVIKPLEVVNAQTVMSNIEIEYVLLRVVKL